MRRGPEVPSPQQRVQAAWDKAHHLVRHAARAEANCELAQDLDEIVQAYDAAIGSLDVLRRKLELQRDNFAFRVPKHLAATLEPESTTTTDPPAE